MCALADAGKKTAIRQKEIEDKLTVHLGATQPSTLRRHLGLMVRLGYLKEMSPANMYSGATFDLVGRKVMELRLSAKAQKQLELDKGGRRRH